MLLRGLKNNILRRVGKLILPTRAVHGIGNESTLFFNERQHRWREKIEFCGYKNQCRCYDNDSLTNKVSSDGAFWFNLDSEACEASAVGIYALNQLLLQFVTFERKGQRKPIEPIGIVQRDPFKNPKRGYGANRVELFGCTVALIVSSAIKQPHNLFIDNEYCRRVVQLLKEGTYEEIEKEINGSETNGDIIQVLLGILMKIPGPVCVHTLIKGASKKCPALLIAHEVAQVGAFVHRGVVSAETAIFQMQPILAQMVMGGREDVVCKMLPTLNQHFRDIQLGKPV